MLYLSDTALHYAVDMCCYRRGQYKVGIMCGSTEKREDVLRTLRSIVAHDDVRRILHSGYEFEILLNNGNSIRVFLANERFKGVVVNLLIIDNDIPNDVIDRVLLPMERDCCPPKPPFGSLLYYVSPTTGEKTPCLFIRDDHGKAVVFFEHAEWAARVGYHQLEKIPCA